ncbi:C4-type zinc ribbon domain-containing protein [Tissierella sp.]|uniref:zinc ribbon domain-containing protein n=1 Tax=Tissierella sp. TaxID=41274 RepID=UPI00285CA287|nr:C4-type zinc ribbon domain-containing protein [Tissierella sp.]MDR7857137.1 C4-type zinc ribbon domain-containing protein [Tissierella sp.]
MEQLDLLWNLEIHHNSLEAYKKKLSNLQNSSSIMDTEKEIMDIDKRSDKIKLNQGEGKKRLIESNRMLKEYNYKIEEVEKNLYDGSTSNPKQLEYLSEEKDKLKEIINETEIGILEFMDDMESLDEEIIELDKRLKSMKDNNLQLKREYEILADDLKNNIQIEVVEIKSIEEKVDGVILNQYKAIRNNRGTGIVQVKGLVCGGCNMMIPTFLADKLNNNNEIIYCESCGRILYK